MVIHRADLDDLSILSIICVLIIKNKNNKNVYPKSEVGNEKLHLSILESTWFNKSPLVLYNNTIMIIV